MLIFFCSFIDYMTVIYFLFKLFFSFLFQLVSIQLTHEIGIYVIVFLIQVFNVYYYLLIQSRYIIWKYIDLFCYKNCQLFISTLYLVSLARSLISTFVSTGTAEKKLTKDGKDRKLRIVDKLFHERKLAKLIMGLYSSVFPLLKSFVILFKMKEPLIHLLHEEQVIFKSCMKILLNNEFLLCFYLFLLHCA